MKVSIKDNGYKISTEIKKTIQKFEYVASKLFPDGEIEHFYYGEKLDMVKLKFHGCAYADFNITYNRVSLTGYECTRTDLKILESMTINDECYSDKSKITN